MPAQLQNRPVTGEGKDQLSIDGARNELTETESCDVARGAWYLTGEWNVCVRVRVSCAAEDEVRDTWRGVGVRATRDRDRHTRVESHAEVWRRAERRRGGSEVGLDSLSTTEMIEQLESALGAKIDRAAALAAPTLRDLVALIEANAPRARAAAVSSSREDSGWARPRDVAGMSSADGANRQPARRRSAPAVVYPGRDD